MIKMFINSLQGSSIINVNTQKLISTQVDSNSIKYYIPSGIIPEDVNHVMFFLKDNDSVIPNYFMKGQRKTSKEQQSSGVEVVFNCKNTFMLSVWSKKEVAYINDFTIYSPVVQEAIISGLGIYNFTNTGKLIGVSRYIKGALDFPSKGKKVKALRVIKRFNPEVYSDLIIQESLVNLKKTKGSASIVALCNKNEVPTYLGVTDFVQHYDKNIFVEYQDLNFKSLRKKAEFTSIGDYAILGMLQTGNDPFKGGCLGLFKVHTFDPHGAKPSIFFEFLEKVEGKGGTFEYPPTQADYTPKLETFAFRLGNASAFVPKWFDKIPVKSIHSSLTYRYKDKKFETLSNFQHVAAVSVNKPSKNTEVFMSILDTLIRKRLLGKALPLNGSVSIERLPSKTVTSSFSKNTSTTPITSTSTRTSSIVTTSNSNYNYGYNYGYTSEAVVDVAKIKRKNPIFTF